MGTQVNTLVFRPSTKVIERASELLPYSDFVYVCHWACAFEITPFTVAMGESKTSTLKFIALNLTSQQTDYVHGWGLAGIFF